MKQREQAELFLAKAAQDETLVDAVLTASHVADEVIGFHLQQAAEKLLKALLSACGVAFRRTHDLRELMDLAADAGHAPPRDLADLDVLTPFATLLRYSGVPASMSLDRGRLRQTIRRLRKWVEEEIGALGSGA